MSQLTASSQQPPTQNNKPEIAPFRYKYIDGELVYEDEDGNYVPEFEGLEDATVFEDYFYPNIIPATTIAADIGGGMYGAGKGFEKGLKIAG